VLCADASGIVEQFDVDWLLQQKRKKQQQQEASGKAAKKYKEFKF